MRLGVQAAGGQCVSACEIDPFSATTYQQNFSPSTEFRLQDIRQVRPHDIPDHDLLVAGVPCEPFSIARASKEAGLPVGPFGLFFSILDILKVKRPSAFILESVKHLISHDQGRTFDVIRTRLTELGYYVHSRVINASGWVPQNRERLFTVGFSPCTSFDFGAFQFPDSPEGPRLRSILHPEDGTEHEEPPYTEGPEAKVHGRYILTESAWTNLKNPGHLFGQRYRLVGPEAITSALTPHYCKDASGILVHRGNEERPRRLTPRECARLMGFDGPHRQFKIPVSDFKAYRQFGNAAVVPVVEAIARAMRPYLVKAAGRHQLELGQ
jgi:DNA (cytosine-5)-methyltransferase 1